MNIGFSPIRYSPQHNRVDRIGFQKKLETKQEVQNLKPGDKVTLGVWQTYPEGNTGQVEGIRRDSGTVTSVQCKRISKDAKKVGIEPKSRCTVEIRKNSPEGEDFGESKVNLFFDDKDKITREIGAGFPVLHDEYIETPD